MQTAGTRRKHDGEETGDEPAAKRARVEQSDVFGSKQAAAIAMAQYAHVKSNDGRIQCRHKGCTTTGTRSEMSTHEAMFGFHKRHFHESGNECLACREMVKTGVWMEDSLTAACVPVWISATSRSVLAAVVVKDNLHPNEGSVLRCSHFGCNFSTNIKSQRQRRSTLRYHEMNPSIHRKCGESCLCCSSLIESGIWNEFMQLIPDAANTLLHSPTAPFNRERSLTCHHHGCPWAARAGGRREREDALRLHERSTAAHRHHTAAIMQSLKGKVACSTCEMLLSHSIWEVGDQNNIVLNPARVSAAAAAPHPPSSAGASDAFGKGASGSSALASASAATVAALSKKSSEMRYVPAGPHERVLCNHEGCGHVVKDRTPKDRALSLQNHERSTADHRNHIPTQFMVCRGCKDQVELGHWMRQDNRVVEVVGTVPSASR